jgi:hypothetical protein
MRKSNGSFQVPYSKFDCGFAAPSLPWRNIFRLKIADDPGAPPYLFFRRNNIHSPKRNRCQREGDFGWSRFGSFGAFM